MRFSSANDFIQGVAQKIIDKAVGSSPPRGRGPRPRNYERLPSTPRFYRSPTPRGKRGQSTKTKGRRSMYVTAAGSPMSRNEHGREPLLDGDEDEDSDRERDVQDTVKSKATTQQHTPPSTPRPTTMTRRGSKARQPENKNKNEPVLHARPSPRREIAKALARKSDSGPDTKDSTDTKDIEDIKKDKKHIRFINIHHHHTHIHHQHYHHHYHASYRAQAVATAEAKKLHPNPSKQQQQQRQQTQFCACGGTIRDAYAKHSGPIFRPPPVTKTLTNKLSRDLVEDSELAARQEARKARTKAMKERAAAEEAARRGGVRVEMEKHGERRRRVRRSDRNNGGSGSGGNGVRGSDYEQKRLQKGEKSNKPKPKQGLRA